MKTFDAPARSRIRQALIDYMVQHDIGVPALAHRIAAAHPRTPQISISTLQRFLAGRGRAEDMNVAFYEAFIAQHPVRDPDGDLGRSLLAFYGGTPTFDVAGAYTEIDLRFTFEKDDGFWRIAIRPEAGSGYQFLKGAAVETGGFVFAILKDMLTGLPQSYVLARDADRLTGHCIGPNFADKDPKGFLETITLEKETDHGL